MWAHGMRATPREGGFDQSQCLKQERIVEVRMANHMKDLSIYNNLSLPKSRSSHTGAHGRQVHAGWSMHNSILR